MSFGKKIWFRVRDFTRLNHWIPRASHQTEGANIATNFMGLPSKTFLNAKQGEHGNDGMRKSLGVLALLGAGVSGILGCATMAYSFDEAEEGMACASFPWTHNGLFSSFDHSAIRRGEQVYRNFGSACHSMEFIAYRDLVGVAYTEEEVKAMAAEVEVVDGPNDEGEMYTRPGRLSDYFPAPYPNEEAARFANGGAAPPDLSLMIKARPNGENYVFSLLTGYREPPYGVSVRDGLYYNPYFPGGAIAMPKILHTGGMEYEDGTPATASQMAKDVVTFLTWCAYPELEERKMMGIKFTFMMICGFLSIAYYKRWLWSLYKSRKVVLDVIN